MYFDRGRSESIKRITVGVIMFQWFKKKEIDSYDKENQIPVVKCSICNGEQVAGFQDKQTGKFTEVMLIRDEDDLETFKEMYGITEIKKVY